MTLKSRPVPEACHIAPDAFNALQAIIGKGGPSGFDYPVLDFAMNQVRQAGARPQWMELLLQSCDFLQDKSSIMGHIRTRPYGYAGDFEIIEKIYQQEILDESYRCWDTYALQHPAAVAVRNRKSYFRQLIRERMKTQTQLELCDIASGPGRDLYEAYNELQPGECMNTTCVEMDPKAIAHAAALNRIHAGSIRFIEKNVFRFDTDSRFDIVWSAGLFDYFEDAVFVRLLRRFAGWLRPGGEIVIGNFNETCNPSRTFMEVFGDWHLIHRSEEKLLQLAQEAGFSLEQLRVGREPQEINLFLHIRG
jgi:extracellular factor (EF) 3-hydroxypalmitic acid methyl ester biosynthesis protein